MSGRVIFHAESDGVRISHDIPENYIDAVNAVSYFITNVSENSDNSSDEYVYYLCLKKNTVIFRIDRKLKAEGIIFDFEDIIYSWNKSDVFIYNVLSGSAGSETEYADRSGKAAEAAAAVSQRFRNKYIPQPFCLAVSDDGASVIKEISRRHDDEDDPFDSFIRNAVQPICVAYEDDQTEEDDTVEDETEEDRPFVLCHLPEPKKKSFFQMLAGKKEKETDLRDQLYLRYDDKEVPLNSFAQSYISDNGRNSILYRLDELKNYQE